MNHPYYRPNEFSWYDIKCAALVLLPIVICGVLLAFGVIWLIPPVSAETATIYTNGTQDGYIYQFSANSEFLTIRNAAGNNMNSALSFSNPSVTAGTTLDRYSYLIRNYYEFNISSGDIPSNAIISSAVVGLAGKSGAGDPLGPSSYGLTRFKPATNGTAVSGDFDSFDDDWFSNQIATGDFVDDDYNEFTINQVGLDNITYNGWFNVMLRDNHDVTAVTTGWTWANSAENYKLVYTGEQAGTEFDPFIEITYTLPDTTPPASITDLTNVTTCQNITFEWTNPTDEDFGGIHNWLNDAEQEDIDNVTTSILFEDLEESTEYTFSTKTFDILGNTNTTWVNLTSTTDACTAPTPTPTPSLFVVSFIANTTCGSIPLPVQFNDTTTGIPTSWNWSFGEGNYSDVQNPNFTYSDLGLYSINLTANNTVSDGFLNRTDYIRAVPDWYICPPTPTPAATWYPVINPSTDVKTDWLGAVAVWWWLPILILVMMLLFGGK